jgi:hypothetical protein
MDLSAIIEVIRESVVDYVETDGNSTCDYIKVMLDELKGAIHTLGSGKPSITKTIAERIMRENNKSSSETSGWGGVERTEIEVAAYLLSMGQVEEEVVG